MTVACVSLWLQKMNFSGLTWDYQCLAAHDEDDLHWPELAHSKPLSLTQSDAQFGNKHCTKPANTERDRDIRRTAQLI